MVEGSLAGLRRADADRRSAPPISSTTRCANSWTGRPAIDRDGGTDSLLQLMRREVDAEMNRADAAAGGRSDWPAEVASAKPPPPAGAATPPPGIAGDVTPAGGYKSKLPDDDVLPDVVDPDPCKSPEQVAKMPGIVVGRTLAKQLEVGLGDCVQVTSPQIGMSFGSGARAPIAKQFRVIAHLRGGLRPVRLEARLHGPLRGPGLLRVRRQRDRRRDEGRRHRPGARHRPAIDALLDNGIYHTMDWRELNHGLFTALLIQQIGMSFVLGLIILVAACTVIATLIMVVLEKKKEIALLKALGAKNDAILRIFLYQGGIIGLVGTALGILIGWLCCRFLLVYASRSTPRFTSSPGCRCRCTRSSSWCRRRLP